MNLARLESKVFSLERSLVEVSKSQKILGKTKILGMKKILGQKEILGLQKYWVPEKNYGSKKI